MNAYERSMKRIKGEPVDRPPNWNIFMGYYVHFIGKKLSQYYLDYRVMVDGNLAMLEAYDLDIVQTLSDAYRETYDFGAKIIFPEDDLPRPVGRLLEKPADLAKIKPPDPYTGRRMSDRLEAVRSLREKVGGEVPILGWVEGALAEANDLRGDKELMMDLVDRPEWMQELLEMCCQVGIAFAKAQIEAGADIIGLGDAIASLVSPQMYQTFVLPYQKRVFDAVHQMGKLARLHVCGNTTRLLSHMVASGADIIDVDWMVDIRKVAEVFGERAAPCGNFDPVSVMYQGKPAGVRQAALYCLQNGGKRLISGAGCEIPDATPHENLLAHTQLLKEYGQGIATNR